MCAATCSSCRVERQTGPLAGVLQTEMQLGDSLDFVLYTDKSWRAFEFFDHDLRERVGFTVVDGYGTLAGLLCV